MIDINTFNKGNLKINIPAYNGETQYSKITYEGSPIIIQTPISLTKQGVIKHGKRLMCDLMFKSIETEFLHWVEELESGIQNILHEKSKDWFEQSFELTDIEALFISPLKIFKSGKYFLLRAFLKDSLKVFRDKNDKFGLTYLDITPENNIISILEFKGIKYSSKDFQFDTEIRQIMITSDPYETNCFIKSDVPLGKNMITDINEIVENIMKAPNVIDTGSKLKEMNVDEIEVEDSNIQLNSTEDFYKLYTEAKLEAEETKKRAIEAHLKMEEIKQKYNIESDSESE